MDIQVINLDRSVDRFTQFQKLNFEVPANFLRWPAVDGRMLDPTQLVREQRLEPEALSTYGAGGLGCALSHLALWEQAIGEVRPLTICEDDAIFNLGFPEAAERTLPALRADWDLVLWGWNFNSYLSFQILPDVSPCHARFDERTMRAGIEVFRQQAVDFRLYPLFRAFGIPCYSISPKGAALLSRHCVPLRPMRVYFPGLNRMALNCGIDIMMNAAYPEINAFVSFPPLVITPNDHASSTIQNDPPLAPKPAKADVPQRRRWRFLRR